MNKNTEYNLHVTCCGKIHLDTEIITSSSFNGKKKSNINFEIDTMLSGTEAVEYLSHIIYLTIKYDNKKQIFYNSIEPWIPEDCIYDNYNLNNINFHRNVNVELNSEKLFYAAVILYIKQYNEDDSIDEIIDMIKNIDIKLINNSTEYCNSLQDYEFETINCTNSDDILLAENVIFNVEKLLSP